MSFLHDVNYCGFEFSVLHVRCYLFVSPFDDYPAEVESVMSGIDYFVPTSSKRHSGPRSIPLQPRKQTLSSSLAKRSTVRCLAHDFVALIKYWCSPEIATTMQELQQEHVKLESDPEKLGVLFKEMIQMCLWFVLSADD